MRDKSGMSVNISKKWVRVFALTLINPTIAGFYDMLYGCLHD